MGNFLRWLLKMPQLQQLDGESAKLPHLWFFLICRCSHPDLLVYPCGDFPYVPISLEERRFFRLFLLRAQKSESLRSAIIKTDPWT